MRGGVRYLGLDCEMVEGLRRRSMVAEVGIVDWDGNPVYHTYVQPTGDVSDYRTPISGITPDMITAEAGAKPFKQVQREVLGLLEGNILVGHALVNDLKALGITHPIRNIRNTAQHNFFKTMASRGQLQPQKLATLYSRYVGNAEIQQGPHGALEDARAAMLVYRTRHNNWMTPVVHEGPVYAPIRIASHPNNSPPKSLKS
jgi:RNA exonuclease 4